MSMMAELKVLRNILIRLVVAFFVLASVFLLVSLPWLNATATEWVIENIRTQFIPEGAALAVFGPLEAFFAQATVATLLASLLLVPWLMLELWIFAAPALRARERTAFAGGLVASLGLALCGAAFAYMVLLPVMVREMFAFVPAGVEAVFNLQNIVSLVAGFVLACALIFLLPLCMMLLSYIGLIPAPAWRAYARPAVLLVLVASAIITPDGSGVGMALLSVPVLALYGAGYTGAALATKK